MLPRPRKPKFIGRASVACSIRPVVQAPPESMLKSGPWPPPTRVVRPVARAWRTRVGRLEVDMDIDAARRGDQAFAVGDDGRGSADESGMDAIHDSRIARLADPGDAALAHADVGLHDPDHGIDHQRVVNDEIEGSPVVTGAGVHPHAVPIALARPRGQFVTRHEEVTGDCGQETRVAKSDAVALGRPVGSGIARPGHGGHVTPP